MSVTVGDSYLSAENNTSGSFIPTLVAVVKVENGASEESSCNRLGNMPKFSQSAPDIKKEIKAEKTDLDFTDVPLSAEHVSPYEVSTYVAESNVIIKKEEDLGVVEEIEAMDDYHFISSISDQDFFECDDKSFQTAIEPADSACNGADESSMAVLHAESSPDVELQKYSVLSDTFCGEIPSCGVFPPKNRSILTSEAEPLYSIKLEGCRSSDGFFYDQSGIKLKAFEHLVVDPKGKPSICEQPALGRKIETHLKKHLMVQSVKKPFSGKRSDRACKTKGHLEEYPVLDSKVSSSYRCDYVCKTPEYQKEHSFVHFKEELFLCEHCGFTGKTEGHLQEHLVVHSKEKAISCERRGYVCKTEGNFKEHLVVHPEKKLFSCTQCNAKFQENFELRFHLFTHISDKPFSCANCTAKFKTLLAFKRHLLIHNAEKRFLCTSCPTRFKNWTGLKQHLTKHNAERPFSCTYCPAKFIRNHHLQDHLLTHTCKRPITVKLKSLQTLRGHVLVRTREKPLSCTLCPARFRFQTQLKSHLATHSCVKQSCKSEISKALTSPLVTQTNKELYICTHCSAEFRSAFDLKYHLEISNVSLVKVPV